MTGPTEEPTPLDLALQLADDDVAREYEDLAQMEDLGAIAAREGAVSALLEAQRELALVRDELEELALLEDRAAFTATHQAEAETHEDRVARRFEGMDVDALDALAHWDDGAESREWHDDLGEGAGDLAGG